MRTKMRDASWASQVPAGAMAAGGGPGDVAYDRTAGAADPGLAATPADAGGAGQPQQPVPNAPVGLLASIGGTPQSTAQLSNADLSTLDADPEEEQVASMQAALEDPQTPPQQRAAIEQQIALAARRQLLGGTP